MKMKVALKGRLRLAKDSNMQVTIEIRGSKETRAKLKKLGLELYNFRNAMKEIGTEVTKYYANDAFNSQGGEFGSPWPQLSPKTIAIKSKLYPQFVNMPLMASGTMRKSFVATYNSNSVIITNSAPYYKYHQSTLPRKKIPRRQMAGINDPVKRMIKATLKKDIQEKIRGM